MLQTLLDTSPSHTALPSWSHSVPLPPWGGGHGPALPPPHCCRVRLICNTSMSHSQLFLALLLELSRAPGIVPQLRRGQCSPHCQSPMPSIGGGDFGPGRQRAGAALLFANRFPPCPFAICPHPLSHLSLSPVSSIPAPPFSCLSVPSPLSHLPFIPAPILLNFQPCPTLLPTLASSFSIPVLSPSLPVPFAHHPHHPPSLAHSLSTTVPLALHLCPLCPPSSSSCSPQHAIGEGSSRRLEAQGLSPLSLCCGDLPVGSTGGPSCGFGGLPGTAELGTGQ